MFPLSSHSINDVVEQSVSSSFALSQFDKLLQPINVFNKIFFNFFYFFFFKKNKIK